MSKLPLLVILALGVLTFAGCNHLDVSPAGGPDRVLSGVVTGPSSAPLPPDTEVTVRVVGVPETGTPGEQLGEQTILNPGAMPVAFRVEYRADDAMLRRGVTVEARVSIAGRLRYTNVAAHPLTLRNADETHVLEVTATKR